MKYHSYMIVESRLNFMDKYIFFYNEIYDQFSWLTLQTSSNSISLLSAKLDSLRDIGAVWFINI